MSTTARAHAQLNHLHRADAITVLRALPDASIDMVFTDPPYSSGGLHSGARTQAPGQKYVNASRDKYPTFSHDNKDQRSWTFWCMTWLAEAYRATKDWRGVAVWDKTPGRARPRAGGFSQQAEFLVWATKGPMLPNAGVYLPGVFPDRLAFPKQHMTEKPIGMAREVVRLVQSGGIVCDPFAGSGTFLVAAKEAGLKWIGCELEPAYHELALRRLAASSAGSQEATPPSAGGAQT